VSARSTLLAAALAALVASACSPGRSHAFGAHRYDPENDCLEASAVVDVVEGEDPGKCDRLRCWETPGGEAYVTTTACDAPPDFRDATADGPETPCGKALAAWGREDHGACPG
jgi:hypothetical protein